MKQRHRALPGLKPVWAESALLFRVFFLSALVLSCVFSSPARASEKTLIYDVYAGGIHAVQATLTLNLKDDARYETALAAHTRGLLGKIVPWKGLFESHGWVAGPQDFRPELHRSSATWKNETDIKEYRYTKDRTFIDLTITDHEKEPHKKPVDTDLTDQTTDVLSATLAVMDGVAQGQSCESQSEVFDGKRRFAMIFKHQEDEQLEASKYNIYSGPSAVCTVEVKPLAGKWRENPRGWMSIQEQGRKRGTMPTVWLGQVDEEFPAVPVKIRVKTAYGTLFMHLAEYRDGDDVLIADKRAKD